MPFRVLCTNHVPEEHFSPLAGLADIIMAPADGSLMSREEVLKLAPTVHGIINQAELAIDEELLSAAPSLRVVANVALGIDNFDLDALARHGVATTYVPDAFIDSTADCALGLILAVMRRLVEADAFVRSGGWTDFEPGRWDGRQLRGRVLGIVGYGRIGRAVARRAEAFGLSVVHHTRTHTGEPAYLPLDALLDAADIVCLCLPLNAESLRLFDAGRLAKMRKDSVLINVARGRIIDESALVEALRSGPLAGAGLDVFEDEPLIHPGLLSMKQVVLTPHLAGGTEESRRAARLHAAANVAAVLSGKPPLSPVNLTPAVT